MHPSVPEDEDTTDETEDEKLYDDKLLPQEKIRLKKLQTDIKGSSSNIIHHITLKPRIR